MNNRTSKSAKQVRKTSALLPVSRKFYQEIMDRVRSSFAAFDPTGEKTQAACCAIELYLLDGVEPAESVDASVRLMFALLRPEIDKAMARSFAARNRRRKSMETVGNMLGCDKKLYSDCRSESTDEEISEQEPAIKLNRRQRRLCDRIGRRLQKKRFGCLAHIRK